MGEGFLHFYRERIRESWKIAFFSALAVGLIAHLYKFMNTLPNHDALYFVFDTMDFAPNGRWLLLLCLVLIPVFACIWRFLSPGVYYHMLMRQSLSVLYVFTVALFDRFCPVK